MTGLSNGVNGNRVGSADAPIDRLLGPLRDNGGPTLTHALLGHRPADQERAGSSGAWRRSVNRKEEKNAPPCIPGQ